MNAGYDDSRTACLLPHYDRNGGGVQQLRERPTPTIPGLLLCKGHYAHLEQTLAELPALVGELEASMIPGSGAGGPKVSGDPETALPFNERAGAHSRRVRDVLASWAGQVVQDRQVRRPRFAVEPLAAFLTVHHEWVAGQEWVGDYARELRELRGRGLAVLASVPRRRVDLGPCREDVACDVTTHSVQLCDGILRATVTRADDELPSVVACTVCGKEHPAAGWRALARRLRGDKDAWLTGPQLSEMWRVPFSTVRRWAAEDDWRRHPDGARPTRFHADDAEASHERRGRQGVAS